MTVQAGQGALFPTAPFNCTVWPAGQQPTAANAEVVRVTLIATDTFTIQRQQEGSNARNIAAGDQIANTDTVKVFTDIENLFPVTEANLSISNNTTGNVSTSAHGFVPIAPGGTTNFLRGDATWATPTTATTGFAFGASGGSGGQPATMTASGTDASINVEIQGKSNGSQADLLFGGGFGLQPTAGGSRYFHVDGSGNTTANGGISPGNFGTGQSNQHWMGSGVPSNSNGANGDFFFRSDGTSGTRIYHKEAGSWVGIV